MTGPDEEVHLLIRDDGQGFDPERTRGGLGLSNIRERVPRLNGHLKVTSAPGRGTTIEAILPYRKERTR